MAETRNYLKVYTEEPPDVIRPDIEGVASLPEVLQAFRRATGWSLAYEPGPATSQPDDLTWSTPVNPGVGVPPGHLRLDSGSSAPDASGGCTELDTACQLAAALGGMLSELLRAQHMLWQREAELAAGVPVVPHPRAERHLAARLEAVLKGGAEAVDCDAAALYLLDEATTVLKLRSCWGLPRDRLTAPARPLDGALADLEALLGHAVVLDDTKRMPNWNVPEDFAAAVCVPVSSPTTILGTLWMFCRRTRDFDDRQTNLIEMVAGRLAADLEREMLMREGVDGAALKRQMAAAERLQRGGLPVVSPQLDGWQVAGVGAQADRLGGAFFDWFTLPEGGIAVALGDAVDGGVKAALAAAAAKTALRSHGQYLREAGHLLAQVNLTLWTGSAGDQQVDLFCGLIGSDGSLVRFASAGQLSVLRISGNGWESLLDPSSPLGGGPQGDYREQQCRLEPGQALVVFNAGFRDALDERGHPLGEAGVGASLAQRADLSAQALVALACDRLEAHALRPESRDRAVLVLKRTSP